MSLRRLLKALNEEARSRSRGGAARQGAAVNELLDLDAHDSDLLAHVRQVHWHMRAGSAYLTPQQQCLMSDRMSNPAALHETKCLDLMVQQPLMIAFHAGRGSMQDARH